MGFSVPTGQENVHSAAKRKITSWLKVAILIFDHEQNLRGHTQAFIHILQFYVTNRRKLSNSGMYLSVCITLPILVFSK